jgi:hypothetical protein
MVVVRHMDNNKSSVAGYTTVGDVRGACGHTHRTLAAAQECLRRDQRGCRAQGGYSDRRIMTATDGDWTLVDEGAEE